MKLSLIIKYIGYKLALGEPKLQQAKQDWGEEDYLRLIAQCRAAELDPAFKADIEATLRRRFNLHPHKGIFYDPSVEQWVKDVMGQLSKDDIFDSLCQMSGLKRSDFEKATIGNNVLNLPFLEDLVELFEGSTGKEMLRNGHLWHVSPKFSYDELAEFFATV